MNIIAIETATPFCAVGIRTGAGHEVTHVVGDGRRHTEALVPAMHDLLAEVALQPREITRVVVDRGPGLFTGLRVGIATAIAFSQGVGCELVGLTSLEMLAGGAFDAGVRGSLVACVDGRRGEIFTQTFLLEDGVSAVDAPRVTTAPTVAGEWIARETSVTFTGDGVERYREAFSAISLAATFEQVVPSVHTGLTLGLTRPAELVISPLYLREADAVANFTTRARPR